MEPEYDEEYVLRLEKSLSNKIEDLILSTEVVNIDNTGESVFVDAIIKCKDGTLKNVSNVAKWESKNNDIAITYQGRILAINKGQTIVRVSFANYTKEIIVNVNNSNDVSSRILKL